MEPNINVAIVGASGYTGIELVRILLSHPRVNVKRLFRENPPFGPIRLMGGPLAHINGLSYEPLSLDDPLDGIDVSFLALPHGQSGKIVPFFLQRGIRVIDLGADFRFKSKDEYEKIYGIHPCPEYMNISTYGMPELFSDQIKESRLVANPGCYATSAILFLAPLLKAGFISEGPIIIDAKSGFSGAGKKPTSSSVFAEIHENLKAYEVFSHRHAPEMVEVLRWFSGKTPEILLTPYLLPINRGILSSIYVRLKRKHDYGDIEQLFNHFYEKSFFVRVLPRGIYPEILWVRGSNFCDLGFTLSKDGKMLVGFSCLDNLTKGASGQAVQNMNVMQEFDQTLGLKEIPLYP